MLYGWRSQCELWNYPIRRRETVCIFQLMQLGQSKWDTTRLHAYTSAHFHGRTSTLAAATATMRWRTINPVICLWVEQHKRTSVGCRCAAWLEDLWVPEFMALSRGAVSLIIAHSVGVPGKLHTYRQTKIRNEHSQTTIPSYRKYTIICRYIATKLYHHAVAVCSV